jgi:WhiB family transcriptional regulator, redox-sensing transcriptional regulator
MLTRIHDDAWFDRAACAGVGWDTFFDAPELETAMELCRSCDVRLDCLRFAIEAELDTGVWGGLTPEGRRRVRYSELVA